MSPVVVTAMNNDKIDLQNVFSFQVLFGLHPLGLEVSPCEGADLPRLEGRKYARGFAGRWREYVRGFVGRNREG